MAINMKRKVGEHTSGRHPEQRSWHNVDSNQETDEKASALARIHFTSDEARDKDSSETERSTKKTAHTKGVEQKRDPLKVRRNRSQHKLCEHQRQRSACKNCGGSSICEHQRMRSKCKQCGGSSICKHQRHLSACKDCGGSSICEHQRERSKCIECGGSSICEHQRVRSRCQECGVGNICEHQRVRSRCQTCREVKDKAAERVK